MPRPQSAKADFVLLQPGFPTRWLLSGLRPHPCSPPPHHAACSASDLIARTLRGPMLDDLRKLFSQAWDSFIAEVGRREPADQVASLLGAMRREMVEVRAQLPLLEQNHAAAVA